MKKEIIMVPKDKSIVEVIQENVQNVPTWIFIHKDVVEHYVEKNEVRYWAPAIDRILNEKGQVAYVVERQSDQVWFNVTNVENSKRQRIVKTVCDPEHIFFFKMEE